MARPKAPARKPAMAGSGTVSGNSIAALKASAAAFAQGHSDTKTDRRQIAQPWQIEAYRHVNICGEARYAVTLFSSMAGRAEIGVSEPQTLARKAKWIDSGPEVDAFAEIAPDVRARSKLIRDYALHMTIAGECYLINRPMVPTDPGYRVPEGVDDPAGVDMFAPDFDPNKFTGRDGEAQTVWEIVAVTELRNSGGTWAVRMDNGNYLDLVKGEHPVIRMWNPDPNDRREAWSPLRSLLPTLREIEWLTAHIFTQVKSRLISAGIWFMPDNITFPEPPPEAVAGGAETLSQMNDAERFMISLAASAMSPLEPDEVAFPTVVMADAEALKNVDQNKLIKFWSEIDDKAMTLRSDNVRRFALGMDLPPEQVLGSSGIAVSGSAGSAGSVNHWGVWANEEQTISAHIEPALDRFVSTLTDAYLRVAVPGTDKVLAYDTASLRLRQDRSKESMELYDRGILKAEVVVRENGFDPEADMMTVEEHKVWLLNRIVSGSATPEQMQAAFYLLTGKELPVQEPAGGGSGAAPGIPGPNEPRSLDAHPHEGPPREQHDHSPAPFGSLHASAEVLVLRAMEKAGTRLLNEGKRGRDRDRTTPPHLAHLTASATGPLAFDFSLLPMVFGAYPAAKQARIQSRLSDFCRQLYADRTPYSREALIKALEGL